MRSFLALAVLAAMGAPHERPEPPRPRPRPRPRPPWTVNYRPLVPRMLIVEMSLAMNGHDAFNAGDARVDFGAVYAQMAVLHGAMKVEKTA